MNNYPTVFVHGFIGWGAEDGLNDSLCYFGVKTGLLDHLREQGFEVYNPSLGPFSSAWDRACELYAKIYGGTVDYGKVHSEKYGHERFGRTYPGLIKDWGEKGDHEKINLIGHSFGGPTVRVFDYLLEYGNEEEREGTPEDELSPLFKGGQGHKVHTVNTLSGVNNGTTYNAFHGVLVNKLMVLYVLYFVVLLGNSKLMDKYDFHLDHWGLMKDPKKVKIKRLRLPTTQWPTIFRFINNELDNVGFELGPYAMEKINRQIHAHEGTYYFAYRACRTHKTLLGFQMPNSDMSLFCKEAAVVSGHFMSPKLRAYGIGREWLPNDGYVNTIGTAAPLTEKSIEWTPETKVEKGVWYNMPVAEKDHVSWNGLGESKEDLFAFYDELLGSFRKM